MNLNKSGWKKKLYFIIFSTHYQKIELNEFKLIWVGKKTIFYYFFHPLLFEFVKFDFFDNSFLTNFTTSIFFSKTRRARKII